MPDQHRCRVLIRPTKNHSLEEHGYTYWSLDAYSCDPVADAQRTSYKSTPKTNQIMQPQGDNTMSCGFFRRVHGFITILVVVLSWMCEDAHGQMIDLESESERIAKIETSFDRVGFEVDVSAARLAEGETNYSDPITGEKSAYWADDVFGAWHWSKPTIGGGEIALQTMFGRCLWDVHRGKEFLRLPVRNEHAGGPATIGDKKVYVSLHGKRGNTTRNDPNEVRWWDLETGEQLGAIPIAGAEGGSLLEGFGACIGSSMVVAAYAPAIYRPPYFNYLSMIDLATGKSRTFYELGRVSYLNELLLSSRDHILVALNGGTYETWLLIPEGDSHRKLVLDHPSKTLAACFSSDGQRLATSHSNKEIVIWDTSDYSPIRRWNAQDAGFGKVHFAPDGRRLLAGCSVGSVILHCETGDSGLAFPLSYAYFVPGTDLITGISKRRRMAELWSATTGMPVAKPISFSAQRHSAIKTSQGYFDASPEMLEFFRRHESDLAAYGTEKFIEKYYRPDVVRHVLSGVPHELALTLPKGYQKPNVAINLASVSKQSATISLTADSSAGATLQQIQLTRAERPIPDSLLSQLPSLNGDEDSVRQELTIPFPPGKNSMTLSAIATDSFGLANARTDLVVRRPEHVQELAGRLFVLAVGVAKHKFPEYNLQYPAEDAEAIAEKLKQQEGLTFGEVHVQVYGDDRATLQNVKDGLNWLQRVATPDDVAVVFFSGHGLRGRRGLYYITHDGDAQAVQYTCLNWEDVAKSVKQIKAQQTLFLSDVCHAGAFAKTQLAMQSELAKELQELDRVLVFASSQGDELSVERDDLQHGAFTKAVLEGLSKYGDQNDDGSITVEELTSFTIDRVAGITNGAQNPVLPKQSGYDAELVLARLRPADPKSTDKKAIEPVSPLVTSDQEATGILIRDAKLMDGSKSIGEVVSGTRFVIESTNGDWFLGSFDVDGKRKKCWVSSDAVKREIASNNPDSTTTLIEGAQ